MKTFKFNITGIVIARDTEYSSYENDRFNKFTDHGYNGHISIAMAKINNLILGHEDFYLTEMNVVETDNSEYRRKFKTPELTNEQIDSIVDKIDKENTNA